MLQLHNSFTHSLQNISVKSDTPFTLYVCGMTPYDFAHLGHGRVFVTFDLLVRYLKFHDVTVNYCRNITDIDDKLLARALSERGDALQYKDVARHFTEALWSDLHKLNCLQPTVEPTVTDHIPQIIKLIERLIKNDHAYISGGDVYFRVSSFPSYGQLSKQKLSDLRVNARVEPNAAKHDPLDFALWKSESNGFWDAPWGHGRPGWHIECSALAAEYLEMPIAVHGGGLDLLFPHHENDRAQSEAAFKKEFVRCWMHNAFVRINQEKMSKSLGNFFTLRDVFAAHDPMIIRWWYLTHHYRAPLDFSTEAIESAGKAYRRVVQLFSVEPTSSKLVPEDVAKLQGRFMRCLEDDFNMSAFWAVLFESFQIIETDRSAWQMVKKLLHEVCGLTLAPLAEKDVVLTPEIVALVEARERARAEKNWKLADELREKLKLLGYEVRDKKL